MKLIVVANSAGGTCKTSVAHSLAAASSEYGKKTLLIDADPNASLTFLTRVENPRFILSDVIGGSSVESSTITTSERYTFLPSSARLSGIDLSGIEKLRSQCASFDLVIVDTPPGLTEITSHFLALADLILIPITESFLSIRGALHIKDLALATAEKEIRLIAIGDGEKHFEDDLLRSDFQRIEPTIRRDDVALANQLMGLSIVSAQPHSNLASDYRELAYSLLEELGLI